MLPCVIWSARNAPSETMLGVGRDPEPVGVGGGLEVHAAERLVVGVHERPRQFTREGAGRACHGCLAASPFRFFSGVQMRLTEFPQRLALPQADSSSHRMSASRQVHELVAGIPKDAVLVLLAQAPSSVSQEIASITSASARGAGLVSIQSRTLKPSQTVSPGPSFSAPGTAQLPPTLRRTDLADDDDTSVPCHAAPRRS